MPPATRKVCDYPTCDRGPVHNVTGVPTPYSTTGVSPAEALFNRKVRTRLPEIPEEADESDMKKMLIRRNDTENKIK